MDEKNIVTGGEANAENTNESTIQNQEAVFSAEEPVAAPSPDIGKRIPAFDNGPVTPNLDPNKTVIIGDGDTLQPPYMANPQAQRPPQPPQGMTPPVYNGTQPPAGRFVYYPNGARVFVPDAAGQQNPYGTQGPGMPVYGAPAPNTPPPKKSKAGKVLLIIALSLAILFSTVVFGLVMPNLLTYPEDEDRDIVYDSSDVYLDSEDEEISVPDDVSVPESVPVQPMPGETYDDLVTVYENCVDSCVTILCDLGRQGQSLGSGFIIEATPEEGENAGKKGLYVVTNHHVIDGATKIRVKYNDGKIYEATLKGSSSTYDIAVLTTERTDVEPLPMGDSKALKVGQTVVAIGTPSAEELQNTMSYGIISGLNRKVPMENSTGTGIKIMNVIQTTATLNPGNSGGPLINMAGQVIGINAMKLMQDYEGIGFALPSTEASNIISSIINYGKVIGSVDGFVTGTAQLGIQGQTVTDQVRSQYSLGDDCPDGVVVVNVSRGTSVYEAGLSIYDVITEFNGNKVTSIEELKELINDCKVGAKATIKFYRIGRRGETSGYHTIEFKLDSAE